MFKSISVELTTFFSKQIEKQMARIKLSLKRSVQPTNQLTQSWAALEFQEECDGTMITAHDLRSDDIVDEIAPEAFAQHKVIESPPDIRCAGIAHKAPEGVRLPLRRIQFPERVEVAVGEQVAEALPLLLGESGRLGARLGIVQIDLVVRHIQVTAPDDRLELLDLGELFAELPLPLDPVLESTATRVWYVCKFNKSWPLIKKATAPNKERLLTCIDENELVVLGNDGSALGAVLLAELVSDLDGLGLGEQAGARVALLDARQPVAVVALQVRRRWDLGLVALDLLAAEDVRVLSSHVLKTTVLK